jgi:flagellar motility protein MotE (MotC chaperone)
MKPEEIHKLFAEEDFDLSEIPTGHQERFLTKLQSQNLNKNIPKGKIRRLWIPILSVAASIIFIFLIASIFMKPAIIKDSQELAKVSPEMKETQNFYITLINTELEKINASKSPETTVLIDDALIQLEKLDLEYNSLRKDLIKSGQDNRVVFAMISNLQQRIELLESVLKTIENLKEQKNQNHESTYI